MALEHCIAPFLDNCDADNDHRITLQEWGKSFTPIKIRQMLVDEWWCVWFLGNCLQVPQQDMLDKCDDVREAVEENEEGEEEV